MSKLTVQLLIFSAIYFLSSCSESSEEDNRIISRENIQGRWSLVSEHVQTKYFQGEETDTTVYYSDTELRINSTDTCEIFSGGGTLRFVMKYTAPDTLTFSSCPLGYYCDPIIYEIVYKIIDFDRDAIMVLQKKDEIYDYISGSYNITGINIRTRNYIRP